MRSRLLTRSGAGRMACLAILAAALLGWILPQAARATGATTAVAGEVGPQVASAPSRGYSLTPSSTEPYAVCPPPALGNAACLSIIDPQPVKTTSGYKASSAGSLLEGGGEKEGIDPKELQEAYKLPISGGSTQTVAIVDAYDDPRIESDLNVYREKYKVYYKGTETACTKANGCFEKVNQKGEEREYPSDKYPHGAFGTIEDWGLEISLDMEMVSAACPECKILLVEANNRELSNLYAAEDEAATLKATEISNSWGGAESSEETTDDSYFNHPDIPITASAGDSGYGVEYPAASKYVISVGGTTLKKKAGSERGWEESVWEGTGSGCSGYEKKPEWQHDLECENRTDNDVAAVANNNESPVSVYDSYEYEEEGFGTGKLGWGLLGGTSVASPLVSGIEAHASSTVKDEGAEAFYRHALFNVTAGSNGFCGHSYLCEAEEGYNGPTGWGTPDGPLELSSKYSVITEPATKVTASGAQLNGYVYTAGLLTTYHFEYGPTTSYGTNVPAPNGKVGSGTTWQGVSQSINDLHTLDGTYHYRLVATNSSGTIYGADHTFTTVPWVVQMTPNPSESEESGLEGVSCSSLTACTAVSSYSSVSEKTRLALIESWNGSEWKIQSTPKPVGAKYVWPYAVSCTSSTACTAVGYYVNSSEKQVPLAERWSGTEWSVQTAPKEGQLYGVSCATSAECIAVGKGLAERWNGTEWSAMTGGAGTSVSCTSSTFCMAAGSGLTATRWNGTEWSEQTLPSPTGAKSSILSSVSCSSSTACTAVGWYLNSTETEMLTLAERWNGTKWSIQTTANLTGSSESYLEGVSCESSTECIAVGGKLSERWNGTEWAIEPIARPEDASGFSENYSLRGISCISSKACAAVGSHIGRREGSLGYHTTLAERRAIIPPYAETKGATSLSETGATLNGVVNPEGTETKYYFEYGTTKSYGSKTGEVSVGAGTNNLEEGKAITGLSGDTEYHFRIVATSSGGTTDGADQVLSTSGKPTVETKPATSIGETGATLNGIVNPHSTETKYYFEYGTTESYGSKTTEASAGSGTTNIEENKAITGLMAITTYDFRIVATNSHGTTYGTNQTFLTKGKPTVETKTATSVGETEATLNGVVNPRGSETKYYFEYGTTESYGSKTVEVSAGSGVINVEESKAITGLTTSTTYDYRIVAANSYGTTDGANQVFSTTGKPTGETKAATSIGETGATLNGIINPKGFETKYYFEYGTTESYGSKTTEASAGSGTTNIEENKAITGLTAGTTYDYRFVATNGDGTFHGANKTFLTLGWRITSTPNPTGEKGSVLEKVSCTSSTACTGVGHYISSSGATLALAEVRNGEEWKEQTSPKPTGSTEAELDGVSCTSISACTAVGSYVNSSGVAVPLAERWNGEAWSVQEPPSPTGAKGSGLFAVSCASSSACTAVGAYENSAGAYTTLAENWNGTSWSIKEIPNPTGAKAGQLMEVSCTASNACTAIGEYENSAGTSWLAQAENWNGEAWSLQEPPSPTGATTTWPEAVSCTSSTACTAVGYFLPSTGGKSTLAEGWNGKTWSVESTLNPTKAQNSDLGGVSCTSSTSCAAVGWYEDGEPVNELTLAEHWNGTEWSIQTTPNPTGAPYSRLLGVSCNSSTACAAVGYYFKSTGEESRVTLAEIFG